MAAGRWDASLEACHQAMFFAGWRFICGCCYWHDHEYGPLTGSQKRSQSSGGGEGRVEGGGAVGASGRRRGDGAAGQKKRRPAAPQGGSRWTEQQAVVGDGQGGLWLRAVGGWDGCLGIHLLEAFTVLLKKDE